MEIVLLILAIALVFAISISIKRTRDLNRTIDDNRRLRGEKARLNLQHEALKLFVVQGSRNHTPEDFIKQLKKHLGLK
ncbi:hypothetical protein [Salmonella phage SE11]|uniref:Uncharacterized protein n=2 Tax=Tequintavirus SE11 TaxID=2846099 RepID=A0A5C0CI78_9CAUD|nr:hypothetical protein HWC42_gp092 [Salmonella phage SE11]QEI25635.1 hypothetical protein [Salmonella phage SE11]QEI25735.1 hypothetical protein [Salmonella phage SE8]